MAPSAAAAVATSAHVADKQPTASAEAKRSRPGHFKVTTAEVLLAVESLYDDRLQPFGRILLKRLSERALAMQIGHAALVRHTKNGLPQDLVPQIDKNRLRRVCEKCKSLRVVAEGGGEYTALLLDREIPFVDACSPEDPYPATMWNDMQRFFRSPVGQELRLPGGRYACAQALVATDLPFLAGMSLGEVCHVVQLAISHRNLLGYDDGHVVPYDCSEAVIKKRCAALQLPVSEAKKDVQAIPVASLERARECLQQILAPEEGQVCEVPLPNIKRLFRSRFQVELSETSLGHSRLCDLLQDERFSDICSIRFHGNGYIVFPCERETKDLASPGKDLEVEAEGTEVVVSRTFIHLASRTRCASRRTQSLPRNHRLDSAWLSETSTCGSSTAGADSLSESLDDWCPGCPDAIDCGSGLAGAGCPADADAAMPTPSPRWSPAGDRSLGRGEERFACFDTETLQAEAEQYDFQHFQATSPLEVAPPVPYLLSFATCHPQDVSSACSTPSCSWDSCQSEYMALSSSADSSFSTSPRMLKETFRSRTPSPEYPRASFDHLLWRELPTVSLCGPR